MCKICKIRLVVNFRQIIPKSPKTNKRARARFRFRNRTDGMREENERSFGTISTNVPVNRWTFHVDYRTPIVNIGRDLHR